jgi:hypothetical protein
VHVTESDAESFRDALEVLGRLPSHTTRDRDIGAFSWGSVSAVWDDAIRALGRNLGRWR